MPEPKDHYQKRGAVESLLRTIPGFRGYLEKEYRRDSDRLQREWLADRLQKSIRKLDEVSRLMADEARIDALPDCDRLRGRIDRLIGQIRGAMGGYSGFFDLVDINEATLDRVYDHDVAIMDDVESVAEAVESLPTDEAALRKSLGEITREVDQLDERWRVRTDILRGLE